MAILKEFRDQIGTKDHQNRVSFPEFPKASVMQKRVMQIYWAMNKQSYIGRQKRFNKYLKLSPTTFRECLHISFIYLNSQIKFSFANY